MEDDLQEWEMLHNPDTDLVDSSLPAIEGDDAPKSLIRSDYFAFGSNTRCDHAISKGEPQPPLDLGAQVVVPQQVINFGGKQQDLASCEKEEDLIGIEPNNCQEEEIMDFEGNPNMVGCEKDVSFETLGEEIQVRETPVSVDNLLEGSNDGVSEMVNSEEDHLVSLNSEPTSENKKMVWWKHPFELLKFCVFRVSPVWTFSLAAAVVGIVILKKRLSRIKQKTRTIPIKLTVEDKKVSQFMVRAARLNEAFSVVRRVPIIRPILPSGGAIPWPALNLR